MSAAAAAVLTALSDAERLRVYAWLVELDRAATLVVCAESLALDPARLRKIVGSLAAAGLVVQGGDGIRAHPEAVRMAAVDALESLPLGRTVDAHPRLRSVLRNGVAERLPVARELQIELARVLSDALPAFSEATEPELNRMLAPMTTDVALMRRLLVDEGMLHRDPAGAVYRR